MKTSNLVKEALRFCREKASRRASGILGLRSGDKWVHNTFRYGLARQISSYLLANYSEVKSVYLFGSTLDDRAGSMSDIDIILITRKKHKILMCHLEKLKLEILREYKKLVGNGTAGLKELLDINIVDEKNFSQKKGCASLIYSLHTPAIKI